MQIDLTALTGSIVAIILSLGITGWVYKVLSKIIEQLRTEIACLKDQINELKTLRCDNISCKNRIPKKL